MAIFCDYPHGFINKPVLLTVKKTHNNKISKWFILVSGGKSICLHLLHTT